MTEIAPGIAPAGTAGEVEALRIDLANRLEAARLRRSAPSPESRMAKDLLSRISEMRRAVMIVDMR